MAEIPNRVSAVLSDEEVNQCLEQVDQLERTLPFLIALDEGEHSGLPKLGSSGVGFVNQAQSLVKQRSEFMPSSFSVEEMGKDVDLLNKLVSLMSRLEPFMKKLRDTKLVVGSEAYKAALTVYRCGQENGAADLKPTLDEMGRLFQRAKKEKSEDDSP